METNFALKKMRKFVWIVLKKERKEVKELKINSYIYRNIFYEQAFVRIWGFSRSPERANPLAADAVHQAFLLSSSWLRL